MTEKAAAESLVSPLEIVVIGAGLGGLTAARCAQLAGFNVTVYEREPALNSGEYQCGATDLHPRIGLWALKKAKLNVEEGRRLAEKEVSPNNKLAPN
jgi:2-polyprenyl-6-methoxyphenol hydroxylase-like FAD-dependent oxidoreductase